MTDFPWIQSYPDGVRWDAELAIMPVAQMLDDTAAKWPDKPALDFMGKRTSYRELLNLVNRAALGFQRLGVKPGVHVGLFLPNTPHYIISFFAVMKAGGTVVNYSPLEPLKALAHKIEDSETDLMVTLDVVSLYPVLAPLLGKSRIRTLVAGTLEEMAAAPPATPVASAGFVPDGERRVSFAQLIDNEGAYQACAPFDPAERVAVLQYTGGTTGSPKGAMLTHANLSAACSQFWATVNGEPRVMEEGRERVLAILPLFHIYALVVNMLFGVRVAAEIVLHLRFDLETVLKEIASKKISGFPGVPTMFTAIVNHPQVEQYDLRSLKFCGSGGAPLAMEIHQRFQRLAGCPLVEGWGMTETSPTGTFSPVLGRRKIGSCGIPMPGIELKFADVDDPARYVAPGERGEICIRGPNLMKGYWKNPQATAAAYTADGFFRTGDVGIMDGDGFVTIVDRTKDMILCGGFNVYPRNVEEAIYQHRSVAEVSVIGVADAYRGQSPKAFVVLKPSCPPFTLEELQRFLGDRLGRHEMVRALEIRKELPKTPIGKLSKKELYEEEARRAASAYP